MRETFMTTRKHAIEDLRMYGIKKPQTYLVDIIPLVEMIWADGEVQESELAILDEYLHERVRQINEMTGYAAIDFHEARAFVHRFIGMNNFPTFYV